MLKPDDAFIIDAVGHPYNHTPENFADAASAAVISELSYGIDVEATKQSIADDEFSRGRAQEPEPQPWSTVSRWDDIQNGRSAAGEQAGVVSESIGAT
jgi:hypothetical protein